MFSKLFASSGLSLDRLRSLLEVSASGSIARAADGDPVRQSQYSRQIKELEDFFGVALLERHGKGIRLTANGIELARIARFFLLGLSNFQRGCGDEHHVVRIGASTTLIQRFLTPALACKAGASGFRLRLERATDDDIERRLHDLTLDFGIVAMASLGRPLKLRRIGGWRLKLWVPVSLGRSAREAREDLCKRRLPIAIAAQETGWGSMPVLDEVEPTFICDDFQTALSALHSGKLAVLLPDFLSEDIKRSGVDAFGLEIDETVLSFSLAWNPRSIRLNPRLTRIADVVVGALAPELAP